MSKQKIISAAFGIALLLGVTGCSNNEPTQSSAPPPSMPPGQSAMPGQTPTQPTTPAKPINTEEVANKVTKLIDEKFPGYWELEGKTLSKGNYTENEKYGIVDAVVKEFPGSMVSIFVGQDRISSTVKGKDGKPVSSGYSVPEQVAQTQNSGKVMAGTPSALGGATYQKIYIPLKNGDATVAVITVSVSQ